MKKNLLNLSILIVFALVLNPISGTFAQQANPPTDPTAIRSAIDERARKLQEINSQINETQQNIAQTKSTGTNLQKDISSLNYNIKQLNLRVSAGKITIEKLRLELIDLNYNIADIETDIGGKKGGITASLRTIQQNDEDGFLAILLRNGSLADSVSETQQLIDLNINLAVELNNLKDLQVLLNNKLDETNKKKKDIEVETINTNNRAELVADQKSEQEKLLKLTKSQQKTYEQQLTELQKRQDEVAKEIEQLEAALRAKIDPNSIPIAGTGVLLFPVPGGKITQGYGQTPFAIKTYADRFHNGIDIGKYLGAEMIAATDGTVIATGNQDNFCPKVGYGKFIVIRHNNGLTTLYGHMANYIVSVGQTVARGEIIGYMGKTGWATGPHVHFVVFSSATYTLKSSKYCGPFPIGGSLDPMQYL